MEKEFPGLEKDFFEHVGRIMEDDMEYYTTYNNSINSVYHGKEKQAYSLYEIDEKEEKYFIAYFSKVEEELHGYFMEMQPKHKNRNALTAMFTAMICDIFNCDERFDELFKCFQGMQILYFESHGYQWYGDEMVPLLDMADKVLVLSPGDSKGFLYVKTELK